MTEPRPLADLPEDLQERSLLLLEFPLVRERLAGYTTFPPGRDLALALRPAFEPEAVARLQQETTEARLLLEWEEVDFSGLEDIRPQLERARRGGVLTGRDLVAIAQVLHTAGRVRERLGKRTEVPLLAGLARRIPDLRPLEERLFRALERNGEVRDDATPALRTLREEVRNAYDRLMTALDRIVRSALGRQVLQEGLVRERNGRPVLAVKAEHRGRLPGLVHDVSESGATLFVEPLAVVPLTNRWRALRSAEEREVERVLRDLSAEVGACAEEALLTVDLLARLDLTLARARYARAVGAVAPEPPPEGSREMCLVEARHPLLTGEVVPISLRVGGEWSVLLITGPNTGGKTVALKTAGLLALMHQAGFHLPAGPGTFLPVYDGIYADIGDQQSILRSLSTFASHIRAVREVLERATPRSLVLLDELGTSTDPEEGSALARALLRRFRDRGIPVVATTHQREVAGFVQTERGMMNASVELDPETLRPTYRLTLGLPGRSYALIIAERLGLPPEVIQDARSLLSPAHREVERLLEEVQRERALAERLRREAERARTHARRLEEEARRELARIRAREAELVEEVRREVEARARDLLERLKEAERRLAEAGSRAAVRAVRREVSGVRKALQDPEWRPGLPERLAWVRTLRPGDRVRVKGFSQPLEVSAPVDAQGRLEVRIGGLKARIPAEQVEEVLPRLSPPGAPLQAPPPSVPTAQLDLRGLRAEQALERLDRFLDRTLLEGHGQVRVVHGAGTGALRQAVRDFLARHPAVRSFRPDPSSPGDGATLVDLA